MKRFFTRITHILWVLLFLLLPLTSFPLIAKMVPGTMVAVPSGLIATLLAIFWLLPQIWRGKSLPKYTLPLLIFALMGVISTAIGYWREIPPYKSINPLNENIASILTLIMGLAFYFVVLMHLRENPKKEDFRFVLRLITYSGILIFSKSAMEIILWNSIRGFPQWFVDLHKMLVTGPLFGGRISAFAYEPSWLANQMNLIYLPYWLASSLTRWSAFNKRLWKFQIEDACLLLGAATLFFTVSRIGYLGFIAMLGLILLRATILFIPWVHKRISARGSSFLKSALRAGIYLSVALVYAILFYGAAFALRQLDYRNEDIFNFRLAFANPMKYAENLSFGPRVSYWLGGWNLFNHYPLLGVGLGNAGFYFPKALPAYAWRLVEVRQLFFHSTNLLNVKSLWFRILGEAGICGFAAFATFLALMLCLALALMKKEGRMSKFFGFFGLFASVAIVFEGFSVDSFALPYFWVSAGLISAGYEFIAKKSS